MIKKRIFSLFAILALLMVCAVLTVSANDTDVRDTFICPCSDCVALRLENPSYTCPEASAWKSVNTAGSTDFSDGGHYYVGTDTTAGGQLVLGAGEEAVLLIDHCTLRYEGSSRMFVMNGSNDQTEQSMNFHVIGNNGAYLQTKYTGSGTSGMIFQVGAYDTGYLRLYGDLTLSAEEGSASATSGGLVKVPSKGRFFIHDNANMGLTNEKDPVLVGCDATENGGTVYLQSGSPVFTMEAGTIQGGTAVCGGAVYVGAGSVTISGQAQITGGEASDKGGAVYIAAGSVKMENGSIADGKAKSGGNVYVAAGAEFTMEGGSISGGQATSVGGAVYVRGESDGTRATFNMSGGTVTADGSKTGNSKGVRVQGGIFNMSGTATVVSAGGGESGSGIDCLGGQVSLDGAAHVYTPAGKTAYDILVRNASSPKVTVKSTWTGQATIRFNKIVDDDSYTPGGVISGSYAESTGDYTGQLYLQSEATLPRIYGKDGSLVFSNVAVCSADDMTWCKDNAEAVASCGSISDTYIKLFNGNALVLTEKDVAVDFNGREVAVTGTGKLYGFDSTAGITEGTAKVTATGVTLETFVESPATGENFIAVTDEGVSTFHIIKPVITDVSLRPNDIAMYYSGQVICDETVSGYITAYGIAVQLQGMPGADFKDTSMYTQLTETLTPGSDFNGVLVRQVMKDDADNADRADRVVYANAYVTVEVNGQSHTYLASDSGSGAAMSFKTLVGKANAVYRSLAQTQQSGISTMYQNFKTVMTDGTWRVNNIMAANGDDALAGDEDGLKILMIGNSLSVDAGRMLSYVFALEGYDNVRVSTMYKSGCKLWEHADFIANNEAAYTFYNNAYTDAAAVVADPSLAKPTTSSNKTLLYGLQQDDWDIIVMQQGSSQAAQADTYNEDIRTIIDYVLENDKNPETKPTFIWNSIWGYPYNADELAENGQNYVELMLKNSGSDTADAAAQIEMVNRITQAAKNKILTNDQFAYVIPGGTAFIHGCAALSNAVMYNDYIHASDLGRMMVSYVWYSAITGKPVEDLPDTVPGVLRRSGDDRPVTEAEEAALLDAIEKAFAAPFTMPEGFQN